MQDDKLFLGAFYDSCRLLAKMNVSTNELFIIKDEKGQVVSESIVTDANEYLENFLASGVVYEKDKPQMELLLNREYIKKCCETHQNGSLAVYRRRLNGKLIWTRLNIFVPQDYSLDNPMIVLFNRDMPEKEADFYETLNFFIDQAYKAVKANLTTDDFAAVKPFTAEENLQRKKVNIEKGFRAELNFVKERFVHPNDVAAFEKHTDYEYIRDYFKKGNTEYKFYYRRKVKGLYRWVYLTIVPGSEKTADNEIYYFYVVDDHKSVLKMLDIRAATKYAQFFSKRGELFTEGYYEHLLEILSVFTESYLDYYLIDLERDIYFNYKLNNSNVNRDVPYIGKYTQMTEKYLDDNYSENEKAMLLLYSSSRRLQDLLRDKMTVEYSFVYPDGQKVKTTCMKIESKNGIPTKVLCSTLPEAHEERMIIRTFGNFEVYHSDHSPIKIARNQSKELLAYLVDRQGYPVTSKDIVKDILEKDSNDRNAIKYVSTMVRRLIKELEELGYPDVVIKEHNTVRLNTKAVECDYYHFLQGDTSYWRKYHNEYMKEYSWAEETNADLMSVTEI